MKKITRNALVALLALSFLPASVNAGAVSDSTSMPVSIPSEQVQSEQLLNRLTEIKDMDKSDLTFSEKRELRREVRSVKEQLSQVSGGVYVSVGALILIALLLILLL